VNVSQQHRRQNVRGERLADVGCAAEGRYAYAEIADLLQRIEGL
jgi:hypothetical protein